MLVIFNINEGLGLLKLADTLLILINPSPSNVKVLKAEKRFGHWSNLNYFSISKVCRDHLFTSLARKRGQFKFWLVNLDTKNIKRIIFSLSFSFSHCTSGNLLTYLTGHKTIFTLCFKHDKKILGKYNMWLSVLVAP